jgi:hypothetical protein
MVAALPPAWPSLRQDGALGFLGAGDAAIGDAAQGKRILISLIAIPGRSCNKAHEFNILRGVSSSSIEANLDVQALPLCAHSLPQPPTIGDT